MKKLGLALGSGGARGLIHIGVIRALEKAGISVDYISGASIGSCIGAMYAANRDVDQIEERVMSDKWEAFSCLVDPSISGGVLRGNRIRKLLKNWIGVENFSELQIPLTTVAADLISGDEVRISEGDLIEAVQASMAVPMMFKPVKYQGRLLVDGGIVNPVPDDVVKKMGADVVIAVNLDYRVNSEKGAGSYKWLNIVGQRSLNIIRHYLAKYSIQDADFVLNPEIDDPGVIGMKTYLNKKKAAEVIRMGEDLINKKIPKILKALE